jgi:hypothetical protein
VERARRPDPKAVKPGKPAKRAFRKIQVRGRAGEAEVVVRNLFQPDHRLTYAEQKLAQQQMHGALERFGLEPSEPLRKLGD